ncbi:30S ribosomal protein S6 [Oscillospiraceae bacterium OttesenSCG-928-G22]|nr:30S ribosomal protein S6 [Oscillospiraceae bacterium OttesenSCG-928-G22]
MAKLSGKYETIFIVDVTLGEETVTALIERFKTLIETSATIDSIDDWGRRRLAYQIDDKPEGHYMLINFTSDPSFPAELDRVYKITDGIMRSIIVAKE